MDEEAEAPRGRDTARGRERGERGRTGRHPPRTGPSPAPDAPPSTEQALGDPRFAMEQVPPRTRSPHVSNSVTAPRESVPVSVITVFVIHLENVAFLM